METDIFTCIYCKQPQHPSDFNREHVMPKAFGRFAHNLVLKHIVCRDCNTYFGKTVDVSLSRGSLQGAMRYFKGIKPLGQFRNVNQNRVRLSAQTPGQATFQEAEVIETPEGDGLALKPGITYRSVSTGKEQYVSLEGLERGEWKQSDDIDREASVTLSYRDANMLKRLQEALSRQKLAVEILGTVEETAIGQRVLVAIDAPLEDKLLYRAMAKIAFNYLAYTLGRDFALRPILDQARTFIREGSSSDALVNRVDRLTIYGDREEATRREGHVIALDLTSDGNSIVGFVEFFRDLTYGVRLGTFKELAVPISAGHYFDITSMQVFKMDAVRRPPDLWFPE